MVVILLAFFKSLGMVVVLLTFLKEKPRYGYCPVGIFKKKSPDMVVVLLAFSKAHICLLSC